MEEFKTQFIMSDVPTDVTVVPSGDHTFACTLNLVDFFDGGEFEGSQNEPDIILKYDDGLWTVIGESKISLNEQDLNNLGKAIEVDYLNR